LKDRSHRGEEIASDDGTCMIVNECSPTLTGWLPRGSGSKKHSDQVAPNGERHGEDPITGLSCWDNVDVEASVTGYCNARLACIQFFPEHNSEICHEITHVEPRSHGSRHARIAATHHACNQEP
jgi:hypothetical protein